MFGRRGCCRVGNLTPDPSWGVGMKVLPGFRIGGSLRKCVAEIRFTLTLTLSRQGRGEGTPHSHPILGNARVG